MTARQTLALKLLASILLMSALVMVADLRHLPERLSALDPRGVALAMLAVILAVAVSVVKWGLILERRGHWLSQSRLLRHYLVGLFFNNLMPGTVGGDAVRAWATSRDTAEIPEAVSSVLSDRLIAGAGLGLTAAVGLVFMPEAGSFIWPVAVFLAVNLALIVVFMLPRLTEGAVRAILPRRWSSDVVVQTIRALRATLCDWRIALPVLGLSVIFQGLVASVNAALFSAMGLDVGLGACLIFTPMIFALTMLPLSLSGFGVREAAYAYFFAFVGVAPADAVAASLSFFVLVAVISLPGAPLFLMSRNRRDHDISATAEVVK